jgi:hypothetical protein
VHTGSIGAPFAAKTEDRVNCSASFTLGAIISILPFVLSVLENRPAGHSAQNFPKSS